MPFRRGRRILFHLPLHVCPRPWRCRIHGRFGLGRDDGSIDHPDQSTYATWTIDKPMTLPSVLIITRLSATETDFPALINKIQEVARKVGVRTIEAWNMCPNLLGAVAKTGGKTSARERHGLPGSKWYGASEGETATIEWVFNERYIEYSL